MKIIKFIIPSLLLFMPIGVFAGVCDEYTTDEDACKAAAVDSGCYWSSGVLGSEAGCERCGSGYYSIKTKCEDCTAGSYSEEGWTETR